MLESFVYGELLKHAKSAEGEYQLLYYLNHNQYEVDLIVENSAGQLIGLEINPVENVVNIRFTNLNRNFGDIGEFGALVGKVKR